MVTKKRTYGRGLRGRPVPPLEPGKGRHVQAYLEPDLAAKFVDYCRSLGQGPATVIPAALRALLE